MVKLTNPAPARKFAIPLRRTQSTGCNHLANFKGYETYQILHKQREQRSNNVVGDKTLNKISHHSKTSYSEVTSITPPIGNEQPKFTTHGKSFQWQPSSTLNKTYIINPGINFVSDVYKLIQPLVSVLTQLIKPTQSLMLFYGY